MWQHYTSEKILRNWKLVIGLVSVGLMLSVGLLGQARAEISLCTGIIALPVTLQVSKKFCLKRSLTTNESGDAIFVAADNVTIDLNGFSITYTGSDEFTTVAIRARNHDNITVQNGIIRNFPFGIALQRSSGHLLEGLRFENIGRVAAQVNGNDHVVRNNQFLNTGPSGLGITTAIYINRSRNSLVADNVVTGTSDESLAVAIFVDGSSLVELRGNSVIDTKDLTPEDDCDQARTRGVVIRGSTDVTVIDNRILNSTGKGSIGVFGAASRGVNCIDNTVAGYKTPFLGCNFTANNQSVPTPLVAEEPFCDGEVDLGLTLEELGSAEPAQEGDTVDATQ